jgi:hypothetical protein
MYLPADQDALTTAELLDGLTKAIFAEVDNLPDAEYTNRKPAVSSLRRNLQRGYLKRLAEIAMGDGQTPEDCQTVAFAQLKGLNGRINDLLAKNSRLDAYSRAHLEESASRIQKVIDSRLTFSRP